MCGRFTLTVADYDTLARALGVELEPPLPTEGFYRPRFNVAPTDVHWVLRLKEGKRQLVPARWGLVNSWASDESGAIKQINARSETARVKPAFREAFERRRCVVPADGFFEWTGGKGARRPIWYHPPEGGLLLLAGLYESWRDPRTQAWRRTFTILTTPANDLVAPVHDRMPAVLVGDAVEAWLDAEKTPEDVERLLMPAPAGALVPTPVSARVNTVRNDDPSCLAPPEEAPEAPAGDGSAAAKKKRDPAPKEGGASEQQTLPLFGPRAGRR